MATEQVTVIEGDGSSDTVTVTDDPVEDATVRAVKQVIGDETTASEQADSTVAATLLERVTALVDALTSGQADDEVRVALTTDLLSGNIDVDVANQSSGNLTVELAADSLTGNLDVDLAAQTSGALDVSGATVPTEQQTPIQLESSSGTNIDPATEGTVDAIKTAAQALDDALASSGTDEIRVTSPSPLDVSASEVDVNLNSQTFTNLSVDLNAQSGPALDVSGATVTVTDDGALTLAANDGTDIGDVGIEDISPVTGQATKSGSLPVTLASDEDTVNVQEDTALDASAAEIDVDLNSQSLQNVSVDLASDSLANPIDVDISSASAEPLDVSGATVPTEQQSPVKVEDSGGTSIDPATEQKLETVRSLLDKLDDALASVASDTLRTEQQSPVGIEDNAGTQVDPATSSDVQAVESAVGDESTASQEADSSLSATAIERLTALMDALESGRATDEIRVSSVKGATPVPTPIVERKLISSAGSPEAVRGSTTSLGSGAEVRALPTNSGNAYVWISSGSKSESRILTPGDEVFLPTSDLSNVIVDVDTGGEGVSIVAA